MGDKATILMVDDEPMFARLMRQRLRKKRDVYELLFASDGVEALEMLESHQNIDVMMSDINMPRMDGLRLLERIKELYPYLKCVIISAYGDMVNIRRAMNLGAFDFITKPIDFVDLESTLEKTLRETELIKQARRSRELAEENKSLEQVNQMKNRFFADISHEFRTPLTLIGGMASQIVKEPNKWAKKGLPMIQRQTHEMLDLVNQILDLRKLEAQKYGLDLQDMDAILLLKSLIESFSVIIEAKDIELSFQSKLTTLQMQVDVPKFKRIFVNLISNALKFTEEGGEIHIDCRVNNNQLQVSIKDSGSGIPANEIDHLFNRYYRVSGSGKLGTGIGLALVKELVDFMKGSIKVESIEDIGSTFTVMLPIIEGTTSSDDVQYLDNVTAPKVTPLAGEQIELSVQLDLPKLLIIEDNRDVRQYLITCLEDRYHMLLAYDGLMGEDLAIREVPDIIISDVMMPRKNGYEVCLALKKDMRTSHIPILLLTARDDIESKIEGLESGADAYLGKPFNERELYVRLEKLLENRESLRNRYINPFKQSMAEPQNFPQDEFIVDLQETVQANMEDEDFGIEELCKKIGISRTQLHRKIKALTGQSTSHYIRRHRLRKAKELLASSGYNVSEIAYRVGFRNVKYFSRSFTQEYGISPKQTRNTPE